MTGLLIEDDATGGAAQQVQGNVAGAATDSGNPVKIGGVYNTTLPTYTNGQRTDLQVGSRGALNVTLFAPNTATGITAAAANDALGTVTSLIFMNYTYEYNGASWDRKKKPNNASRITSSAASTNGTVAKASAGDLFLAAGYNTNAALRYLKIYNKATAPTVGTDTPILTLPLPPSAAFAFDFPAQYFSAGIAYALTTGVADADTGAVGAGDIVALNLAYA